MSKWYVVSNKKLIVCGPFAPGLTDHNGAQIPLSEEDARTYAARWNTLYADANYEVIGEEEAVKRYARRITWDDVGGQERAKEKKDLAKLSRLK